MSAFVCDDKTINRIANALFYAVNNGGYGKSLPQPSKELQSIMGESPSEFGKTLYLMNLNAVEQRYPDCINNRSNIPGQCDKDGNHLPYAYKTVSISMMPGAIVLYKSIGCYLYQCSEGDVDELPLYKALSDYVSAIACHIVERSPEYEKAPWG